MNPPVKSMKQVFPRTVTLGAMIEIPFDVVGDSHKRRLAQELTVCPIKHSVTFGKPEVDEDGSAIVVDPTPIQQFIVDKFTRTVFVPWSWGKSFLAEHGRGFTTCDERTDGAFSWVAEKLPDPNHPNATAGQAEFFADVLQTLQTKNVALIQAPTGGGKTVTMLNTIAKLGRTALVIVPSKALADQWLLEAMKHLGLKREEIAVMQGSFLEWKGKKLVIAVIHNLFLKEFTRAFYENFGTVCWDEAHRLGAPEFSKTMPLFNARYRIAATATPDRKDGCMSLVTNYFGQVSVSMEAQALPAECRVIRYSDPFAHKYAELPPPTILKILVKSKQRNAMIADTIYTVWKRGRCMLILSDRIEHLQTLQALAHAKGIPQDQTALYVGSYMVKGKRKTIGQAFLRTIRENPAIKLIYATYAMMKEGTDIPRLDSGMDASPRADGEQAIGRIRRPLPNKPTPVWFTIIDESLPIFAAYARARIRDYRQCNVKIIDN